jgi:hypothetical protein
VPPRSAGGRLIFDEANRSHASSYNAGFQAGASGQAPNPPR